MSYQKIAAELKAAKVHIQNPENWTKHSYGRDADGNWLPVEDWTTGKPTCFCSQGALLMAQIDQGIFLGAFAGTRTDTVRFLDRVAGGDAATFNDNHTHEEVMDLWDDAIAQAEALAKGE